MALSAANCCVVCSRAAVCAGMALLLAVERVRNEARASFAQTVSGVDLIGQARTGTGKTHLAIALHALKVVDHGNAQPR